MVVGLENDSAKKSAPNENPTSLIFLISRPDKK
jgi:hypothetical protein